MTPTQMLSRAGMAPDSLRATFLAYVESMMVRHYSPNTLFSRAADFTLFLSWCEDRGLLRPVDISKSLLERYQRHLFYFRRPNGNPLSAKRQLELLSNLRRYFSWLCKHNFLPANPASELELPRLPKRLPRFVLSTADVERVMAIPDTELLLGLRDRAILELLWATGLRRNEVVNLRLYDVAFDKGTLFVREGKGKKDRVVPLSHRVIHWLNRYLTDVRPRFAMYADDGSVFLTEAGEPLPKETLGHHVRKYLQRANIKAVGSCHLFRHACATAMLEGGADVRYVQALLGHASLASTEIYTHVSIAKLKAVYEAAHPSARPLSPPAPPAGMSQPSPTAQDVLRQLELEDEEDGQLHE